MHHSLLCLPFAALAAATSHRSSYEASLHRMYARQAAPNGTHTYPALDVAGPTPRQAWVDKYNQVRNTKPANVPVAINRNDVPVYPNGADPSSEAICQWSSDCVSKTDIYDAPSGIWALSFDDGPQEGTVPLLRFLQSHNMTALNFVIGSRIVSNLADFQALVDGGHEFAIHTWSHPLMTTMTDLQALGEIGWTMQIIYDITGKVPATIRPPYGNTDNRIRWLCKAVFGLETIIWNQDTDDWCLKQGGGSDCLPADGPQTDADLDREMTKFLTGPKTPGLIILEHEITMRSVNAFQRAWPVAISNGWTPKPLLDALGYYWYQTTTAGGAVDPIVQAGGLTAKVGAGTVGGAAASPNTVNATKPNAAPKLVGQNSTSPSSTSLSAGSAKATGSSTSNALKSLDQLTLPLILLAFVGTLLVTPFGL